MQGPFNRGPAITHVPYPDAQARKRAQRGGGRSVAARDLLKRLHERAKKRVRSPLFVKPPTDSGRESRGKFGKRKAALALSAGAMSISTAAIDRPPNPAGAVQMQVDPTIRRSADLLRVSDEMKEAMIEEEGARSVVYRDVAGYPTVGVGHLVRPSDGLRVGDRVSQDRILDFFEADLREAEAAVVRLVGDVPINQQEFDALVDLAFNVGEGTLSPQKSPRLNAAIAARDYNGIASELGYHHARGELAKGLVYRSERRANIFLEGSYANPRVQA